MKREQMNSEQIDCISDYANRYQNGNKLVFSCGKLCMGFTGGFISVSANNEFKLLFFGIAADDLTFDLTEFRQTKPPALNDEQVNGLTRLAHKHPDMTHVAMDNYRFSAFVYDCRPVVHERAWLCAPGGKARLIKGRKLRRAFAGWDWRDCCFDLRPYRQTQYEVIDGNEIIGVCNGKQVSMIVACEDVCPCGDKVFSCQNELAQAIADKLNS